MAPKRTMDQMLDSDKTAAASPFVPMFETFRKELDEHHDRRERTIKASRDITAASKKVYVVPLVQSAESSSRKVTVSLRYSAHEISPARYQTIFPTPRNRIRQSYRRSTRM